MANYFDKYDGATGGNYFDKYDAPAPAPETLAPEPAKPSLGARAFNSVKDIGTPAPSPHNLADLSTPNNGSSLTRRLIGDPAVSLAKGAVGTGEAAIGLLDIPSLGRAGQDAESLGVDFKRTQGILEKAYSPEQQAANEAVSNAKGFLPTIGATVQNPSTIPNKIVESLPQMAGGLAIGKGAAMLAPKISPLLAGAFGEGAITAGSQAEGIRQESKDGLLTPWQTALALGSGALTGAITGGAGALANKLGITDINQLLLGQKATGKTPGLAARTLEGGLTEGAQETVQSSQEQAATNLALDKPIGEGVGNAAALGLLTGGVMGGGVSAISRPDVKTSTQLDLGGRTTADLPNADPISTAIKAGETATEESAPASPPTHVDAEGNGYYPTTNPNLFRDSDGKLIQNKGNIFYASSPVVGQPETAVIDKLDAFANSLEGNNAETETTAIGGGQQATGQATTDQAPDLNAPEPALQQNAPTQSPTHVDNNGNKYRATEEPYTFVAEDGSEWIDESGTLITPIQDTKNAELGSRRSFASSNTTDINAISSKSTPDGLIVHAKSLGDVINSKPFIEHGYAGLDAPTRRVMLESMSALIQNNQISDDIVKLIPVDVMNNLTREEVAPDGLLHNKSMLKDLLPSDVNQPISTESNAAITELARNIASNSAKPISSFGSRSKIDSTGNASSQIAIGAGDASTSSVTKDKSRNRPGNNAFGFGDDSSTSPTTNGDGSAVVQTEPATKVPFFDVAKLSKKTNPAGATIDGRHDVTPSSDVGLGGDEVRASSSPSILPQPTKDQGTGFLQPINAVGSNKPKPNKPTGTQQDVFTPPEQANSLANKQALADLERQKDLKRQGAAKDGGELFGDHAGLVGQQDLADIVKSDKKTPDVQKNQQDQQSDDYWDNALGGAENPVVKDGLSTQSDLSFGEGGNKPASFDKVVKGALGSPDFDGDLVQRNPVIKSFLDKYKVKLAAPQGSLPANSTNTNPIKPTINSANATTKLLADLPHSKSVIVKGFNGLSRDRQEVMIAHVRDNIDDLKVIDSVIPGVMVDMVNMLSGKQGTAKMSLHNPSMLKKRLTIPPDDSVPSNVANFIDTVALLGNTTAFTATKIVGGTDSARDSGKGVPTSSANNADLVAKKIGLTRLATEKVPSSGILDSVSVDVDSGLTSATIDNRHGVTPESNVVLGGEAVSAASSPSILPQPSKNQDRRTSVTGNAKAFLRRKEDQKAKVGALKDAVYKHELTGIPNKRAFYEKKAPNYVVSIDVDSLKHINDAMSHQHGDELLKKVAAVLSKHVETYHVSGDEYWARGDQLDKLKAGLVAAQKELASGKHAIKSDTARFTKPGFSYGIVKTIQRGDNAAILDEALGRADKILQRNKKQREVAGLRAARGEAPKGFTLLKKQVASQFHPAIHGMVGDLTEGGGVGYVTDQHGTITGRTPSLNPEWFQNWTLYKSDGTPYADKPSVGEVKQAYSDYQAGSELKPKQQLILQSISDMAQDDEERAARDQQEQEAFEKLEKEAQFNKGLGVKTLTPEEAEAFWNEPETDKEAKGESAGTLQQQSGTPKQVKGTGETSGSGGSQGGESPKVEPSSQKEGAKYSKSAPKITTTLLWEKSATIPSDTDNQTSFANLPSNTIGEGHPNGTLDQGNDNLQKEDRKSIAQTSKKSLSTIADIKSLLNPRLKKMLDDGRLVIEQSNAQEPTAEGYVKGGIVHLVADNLNKDNFSPVMQHELVHAAIRNDPKVKAAYEKFKGKLQARFNLAAKGIGTQAEISAYQRVISAETHPEHQVEEFAAYLVSIHNEKPQSLSATVRKAIADFIASIRAFLLRSGFTLKEITAADLNALAQYAITAKVGNGKSAAKTNAMASAKAQRFYSDEEKQRATELYQSGMTLKQVSEDTGVTISTILRWLRAKGIATRNNLDASGVTDFQRNVAVEMYKDGFSTNEIAEKINVHATSVLNWVKKHGIFKPRGASEEVLKKALDLYEQGNNTYKIAEELGVNASTVRSWLLKNEKKTRNPSEAKGITDEILAKAVELYKSGFSAKEVKNKLGVMSDHTVLNAVKRAGEQVRTNSEAQILSISKFGANKGGIRAEVKTDNGILKVDSMYEAARILQLNKLPSVLSVERYNGFIDYDDGKKYIPDLYIKYTDGTRAVEEIKPYYLLKDEKVVKKAEAARKKLGDKVSYHIVTELDIDFNFDINDSSLGFKDQDSKLRFRRSLASARHRAKSMKAKVELEGLALFSRAEPRDALNPTIKEAKAILDWVDNGEPIALIKGDEVPRFSHYKELFAWINKEWHKGLPDGTKREINRPDVGNIRIDLQSVRDSSAHGLNRNKVQAFYIVPEVIKNGKILGELPRQQGKLAAFLIAAPVSIDGKKYKMYVEVRHDINLKRMYVHEVVLNDPATAFKSAAEVPEGSKLHSANRGAIYNFIRDLRNVKLDDNIKYSKAAPRDALGEANTPDGFLRSFLNKKTADTAIYNLQDRFIDLKRQMQKVVRNGGQIQESEDVRQAEELYHQRAASRIQDFYKDELNPILQGLHRAGITMDTFQKFLHARHAPSRNKVMAERNPNQATIDENILEAKAELDRTKSGTSNQKAIDKAYDELARWERAEAFRGTEEERLSLSGMSDTEAGQYINGLNQQQRTVMDGLGKRIDAITSNTLDLMVDYGMEKPDMAESLKRQWEYYVPLYRDEAHPDEYGHPIGRGFSVRGTGLKKALGSNAEVTNILAHIAQQREQMLRRGEKNLVTMRLANFISSHPDPSFAEVGKVPTYDTLVNGIKETLPDPNYKNKDNVVLVRVRGKDVGIVFNDGSAENTRLAMSLKNMDGNQLDTVESIIAKGTRWLASVNTQYNVVFGLMNLTRDVQGALVNLSSTSLKGKQAQVFGNMGKALKIISQVERGWDNADPGLKKIYDSFNKNGGTTGYAQMFDNIKDRSKSIQSELDLMATGKVKRSGKWIAKALSDFNTVMENSTRLATYMVGVDNGLSEAKAASIAKNITVNFNRKGAQSTRIGAMYAFFNASAQGTARMAETLSGERGKQIMMAGVALGAATALLGIAAMGDDDWDKIPDFVKSRSLILPAPWNKAGYVAIPMPLGLNLFPNIGRVLVESAFGSSRISNTKRYLGLTGDVIGTFNPLGGSDLSTMIMPTTLDIPLALWRNKDWTGKSIYQEDYNSLDPTPGFKRAKDTATTPSKLIAEGLGKASGGTDYKPGMIDITPDQIDYVIGQLLGGTGREVQKLEETVTAAVKGEEVPLHKIPLLGKLAGTTEGLSVEKGLFYDNLKTLNEHHNELDGLRKEGKPDRVREYLKEYPEARLYQQAHNIQSLVKKLKDRKELLEKAGKPTKALDALIGLKIKGLNDNYLAATRN